ncbi:hypothetical protein JB92DRAFT_3082281 [Gautieria morchelliformis]|nr:hypothetical protein JB92DRAFT_3082281 [Gautieria morchelliformis]
MSSSGVFQPLLSQGTGYGVVVGVGFFFAGLMLLLTFVQSKFTSFSPGSSEEFSSASRNVKPGLICLLGRGATLLQSSTAAWYGVGGTIQLSIFTSVGFKYTIVKVRFGTAAHLLFTFYGVLCNLVVCGSLLLGGAATVNALTGMNIDAACFLLPVGIAIYVVFGGLRATFICDWSHTLILFIIIYIFLFRTFGTSQIIGSTSVMYDLLVDAAHTTPVPGNQEGSYLTIKSNQGLVFGAATILSGFAGIFCDQGAIASAPESTTKAYMLGGISWFSVPWAFASCLGLAARALITNTSAGLAAPAAAAVLMGKGGAVAVLLVVFMAVTSAASAELIAVSSIFIYRTYWRKNASGKEIVRVSHYFIGGWAVWMGAWAVILHRANIDLGWVILSLSIGVVLSPAVIPIGLTVTWSKLNKVAVFAGTLTGFATGMAAWMVGCLKIYGQINIPNLALPYSAVCSGVTSLLFSGIITVGISLAYPANYDFKGTRAISVIDPVDPEISDEWKVVSGQDSKEGTSSNSETKSPASADELQRTFRRAMWPSLILTSIVVVIVPLPMFFAHYIFSPTFFRFWIACSIIWALSAGIFCILLPVWESRTQMLAILTSCLAYFGPKERIHRGNSNDKSEKV